MTTHNLEPERRTLHGHFSRDLEPVLSIKPGDTVVYRTLDAGWGLEAPNTVDGGRRKFEPREPELDAGHALVGPIAIESAEPGMALAIRIDEIRVGSYGGTYAGGWPHPVNAWFGVEEEGDGIVIVWELDPDTLTGRSNLGYTIALRPFMGVMGVAPAAPGTHPTAPPRNVGGNIDCKELVPGSTLYLPIEVPGALFSVGDGHAVQGDGEVCVTAIECPMERVVLNFDLRPEMRLNMPRAHTPEGWVTFGFHEDLLEATMIALEGMLELMMEQYVMTRLEALGMASLTVDMRVTQIANGVRGVHAVLPHGAIR
jgi:acetamidase/formamidase